MFLFAQWEKRGWNPRKLFFPQNKPERQVPERQSSSPTPHGKVSQYSLSYLEQCLWDKQYWQFEVLQYESVMQVCSAAWIKKNGLEIDEVDKKIQNNTYTSFYDK